MALLNATYGKGRVRVMRIANQVLVATDEPHGQIECARKQLP